MIHIIGSSLCYLVQEKAMQMHNRVQIMVRSTEGILPVGSPDSYLSLNTTVRFSSFKKRVHQLGIR